MKMNLFYFVHSINLSFNFDNLNMYCLQMSIADYTSNSWCSMFDAVSLFNMSAKEMFEIQETDETQFQVNNYIECMKNHVTLFYRYPNTLPPLPLMTALIRYCIDLGKGQHILDG